MPSGTLPAMKLALVHELLTMRGGAERVLKILAAMFPDAPIYTLLYDERNLGDWFPRHRVRVSGLQRWAARCPLPAARFNHHCYLPFFPRAVEAWDFSEFDTVLSTSSAFVHGIITNGAPRHVSYIHSPARYLWDRTHDVLDRAGRGVFGPIRRPLASMLFHRLRIWDSEVAERPDALLAASRTVQRRIELYWRRPSTVVYPPLDDLWMTVGADSLTSPRLRGASGQPHFAKASRGKREARSYLIVSQLVPYKRIDLAIRACNRLGHELRIAGTGPALRALQSIAGPTIRFLGFVPTHDLPGLYASARATLFPGDEDFGLVPLESMACGTPVIALRAGGATETVIEGETGEFFNEATEDSLATTIEKFEQKKYSKEACSARAKTFSRQRFEEGIREALYM